MRRIEQDQTKPTKEPVFYNTRENYGINAARKPRQGRVPMDIYNLPIEETTENKRLFYHVEFETEEKRRSTNPYTLKKMSTRQEPTKCE